VRASVVAVTNAYPYSMARRLTVVRLKAGAINTFLAVRRVVVMSSSTISLDSLNPDLRLTSSHLDFSHVT
jgi:hypothetical protein